MATYNISEVLVLDGDKYVPTSTGKETFTILAKHPLCVKIRGLEPAQLEARKVLYARDKAGDIITFNFLKDDGLPYNIGRG